MPHKKGYKLYLTKCSFCDKDIWKRIFLIKKYKTHFCNYKCMKRYRTKKIELKCGACSKKIIKSEREVKKSLSGEVFCNHSCATAFTNSRYKSGESHPLWKGGKQSYRARAFKKYGKICMNEECLIKKSGIKIPEEMLDVDHIDGNRKNNILSNLKVLCVWCHIWKTRVNGI